MADVKEGHSLRLANKRGAARLAAVQALYQMDIVGTSVTEVVAEYETYRLGKNIDGDQYLDADLQWFQAIIAGVVQDQKKLDPMLHQQLSEEWSLSRLDSILRAILRAGLWELMNRKDVPTAVVVNEYVDVAKAFFEGDEPKLVNALLDSMAKKNAYENDKKTCQP
ncbi:transcription antitermination protein NusB [Bartonella australis AUST/NH1]|uniref:Transcription antitermination protein NusB n=1 Tax=Bartonella australis (strain Aust/NH1) TaxID=1094489 RepID=M1NT20_BARAA|nr:transcription antitermination factor NusB [Bartonella australis]AGF74468.1 transcription antitermination protein NusB [Bartonella australis AUST/NH1]